ncbi:MAG: hypothetical protein LBD88_00680 [Candidatus Peribacteria bacterium]|jgi:3-hydroxymyristoyl/3-hydroxydecanoyl-(acyl carrier protein) dehydratase|nr:hypothetical protein [Candidatus Peribacteria bacterium]
MEIEIELISLNNQVNTILKEIVDVDRKTITTENLLNLKEEERLQYITKEYIKNPTE